jgi:hypothetical protein
MNDVLIFGLICLFFAMSIIKISILNKKKEDLYVLKQTIKSGKLKEIANNIVNKIKNDKVFERTFALLIFGDCFIFALNWIVGIPQFIFSMIIILILTKKQV